jgi:hypothetical protein
LLHSFILRLSNITEVDIPINASRGISGTESGFALIAKSMPTEKLEAHVKTR